MVSGQRPKSITVFGILNIIFGAIGVMNGCCVIAAQTILNALRKDPNFHNPILDQIDQVPFLKTWMMISLVLTLISSIVLVVAGIGLLRSRGWARVLSIGYSIYGLISAIATVAISAMWIWIPQLNKPAGPERAGAVFGIALGILALAFTVTYDVLLWYFMTRPQVIAALHEHSSSLGP